MPGTTDGTEGPRRPAGTFAQEPAISTRRTPRAEATGRLVQATDRLVQPRASARRRSGERRAETGAGPASE
ncbi:hypothetical protein [Streptomyces sp. NPDC013457]|uniref:hypothetical protein n=1 Tax=Streptomyces sp. NPDC013457 TaxID=3364866 RepID=UPI0036F9621E